MGACERRRRGCGILLGDFPSPASAQFDPNSAPFVGVPQVPKVPTATSTMGDNDPNAKMVVRADELQYDNVNHRIIAIGNVQIYYKRSTLEADRVIYEQTTKRMRAEGNARFTEADGKVVHGEIIDLTDDFRDGFVDSLQLEAADKTRFAAPRAERTEGGRYTTFQSGVYTACEPCKDDPRKPPRWQVRATRIIHDDSREDDLFRGRAPRIPRRAAVLLAVLLHPGPDGQTQERRALSEVLVHQPVRRRVDGAVFLGARARTTTSR